MKTACFSVLILVVCVCVSNCRPSKPLNQRAKNWQAWLLMDKDKSDKTRQSDLARRKITPKSVFITPTFSPDSLPACAEGYRSDEMGRCVKIIKIDEAVHLDFLLQRLNEQFAVDYEDEPEEVPASGPFQFRIPLEGGDDDDDSENETDVAIVVAPSSTYTGATSVRLDAKRRNGEKFNVENVAAFLGVKPEEVETTSISELTTQIDTTTIPTTTVKNTEEGDTTTLETTTSEITTTGGTTMDDTDTTTTVVGDGLYFRWNF